MKRFARVIALILALVFVFAPFAHAAEIPSQRASYYFTMTGINIVGVSSTQLRVWFEVTATGTMTELGSSKIVVERSSDCVNWTVIKTYRSSAYSNMIETNTAFVSSYITHNGTPGYYYRAYVTFYAKNSSGAATYPYYSNTFYLS